MTNTTSKVKRLTKGRLTVNAAKVAAVSALAAGSLAMVAPAAMAGGTSNVTNGCYAKWWSTAFAGYCTPATVSGQFELAGVCDFQGDYYGPWRYISKGSTVSPFDNSSCRYSVSRSFVLFSNG